MSTIAKTILSWYDTHGRKDLPWRKNISAYRVWLSEIMLQQTQVKTVIPYFNQFIRRFPTIKQLAIAQEDEVLHLWSGLGYYSRARHLHQTAKIIHQQLNHRFPQNPLQLQQLPGIGRSTAGAIAAIAFQQSAPILDGNVKRVLTRLHAITTWPGDRDTERQLWEIASSHTPKHRVNDYTQAIMDFGAMICVRKNPCCQLCPLKNKCLAYSQGQQHLIPTTRPRKTLPIKSLIMLVIKNNEREILLEKRPARGIWGGLWSLPECDLNQDVAEFCKTKFNFKIKTLFSLNAFRHTFTHFHLDIHPVIVTLTNSDKSNSKNYIWYTGKERVGIAAAVKNVLKAIAKNHD